MEKTPLDRFREFFIQRARAADGDNHFRCLGLECRFIEAGRVGMELPYNPLLVGNPLRG